MKLFSDAVSPRTTVIDTAKVQAAKGQGCPRCGGVVYEAEKMLAKGRVSISMISLVCVGLIIYYRVAF